MKEEKYIHGYFKCPMLGLLLETEDENEVAQKLKDSIVKQLSEMSLEMFKKYCTFEKRNIFEAKEGISIPMRNFLVD